MAAAVAWGGLVASLAPALPSPALESFHADLRAHLDPGGGGSAAGAGHAWSPLAVCVVPMGDVAVPADAAVGCYSARFLGADAFAALPRRGRRGGLALPADG